MEREYRRSKGDFRPPLHGCVEEDRRMARALGDLYRDFFVGVADCLWISVACELADCELAEVFDRIAEMHLTSLRRIGALIVALGGTPWLQGRIYTEASNVRLDRAEQSRAVLVGAYLDRLRVARMHLSRLTGASRDRLVSAVLEWLNAGLGEEEAMLRPFLE